MLKLLAFALIPFALVAGNATAAKGGPSPGVSVGWDGTVDVASAVRYVALPAAKTTTVAAVRTSDGRVLRYATIRGAFGIPLVAFDGTAEGISSDGKTLVLADVGAQPESDTLRRPEPKTLRLKKAVTLPGLWAYDALSPNGRMLYATEYLGTGANARYNVRSVSLVTGKPVGDAIIDRREPDEHMNGSPWARTRSANGPGRTRSTRSRTGPGSSTHSTPPSGARSASICRGARAWSAWLRCACRLRTTAARSSWRSAAGTGSRSSTPRPSR